MRLDDFDAFFAAVNDAHEPFAWQRRLCERVAQEGRWPDQIVAPTGTGKSNVVDVHVFLNALHAAGVGPRVPRRLAVVVNRRALVDQHWERATGIAKQLKGAGGGLLAEIAALLCGLCGRYDVHGESGDAAADVDPVLTTSLRGGVRPGAEWIDDPRACAVIAATPDMWGSRLLFRGYGATRYARPREAGLLAVDTVMVLDESHLNRQLLVTARDVANATARECTTLRVPPLNVVATTATPTEVGDDHVGVSRADMDTDDALRSRLLTPKPFRLHPTERWPTAAKASAAYIDELADLAEQLRVQVSDSEGVASTVGCVVNNVDTAVRLTEALRKRRAGAGEVVAWVGRLRPMDLRERRVTHEGLFTVRGDSSVDFLVATQTVEVGVDIDLAAMVTELAPGAAVTQRAGRVNRLGLRGTGPVVVVTPPDAVTRDRLPYRASELESSRQWLGDRGAAELGLAPWTLTEQPPPVERLPRHAVSHLYPGDWSVLAETNGDPFAEVDLDFWLRDDLAAETEPVGFVVRSPLPADTAATIALLRACPVVADEIFPAVLAEARRLAEVILVSEQPTARVVLDRAGELSILMHAADVRPGDTLVVDACHSLTRQGVVTADPPEQAECHRTIWADTTEQALAERDFRGSVVVGDATSRLGDELLSLAADEDLAELSAVISERLGRRVDVLTYPESREQGEEPVWIALRRSDDIVADPEARQEMTPS
ncbi:MAG: type I-U CRISPR-associated helicase/endonuclease Cas3, partial [Actinomycetota bacterium]|nr:type I-U CRISPR-associated helicase/endonuclease Cas3 [Actinomycetota bacterium]